MAQNIVDAVRFPSVCFTASAYRGTQDIDKDYLGYGKTQGYYPVVTLEGIFNTGAEVDSFMTWWKDHKDGLSRGMKVGIIYAEIFGVLGEYGIIQTTALVHTKTDAYHKITFTAKVVWDERSENKPPIALDNVVYVDQNSNNNYIKLTGYDPDGDNLTYEIEVPPAYGTLTGTPPLMLYTPNGGYVGSDCFSFVAKDRYTSSHPAVIAINIGQGQVPQFKVKYKLDISTQGGIRVTGNYWYKDDLMNGMWKRGVGGWVKPVNGDEVLIASNDSYVDDRDRAFVLEAAIEGWGKRTDFFRFFADMVNLSQFSIGQSAGDSKAENCEGMFDGSGLANVTLFDTSSVTNFKRFYANMHNIQYFPNFTLSEGVDFMEMFKDTPASIMTKMDTTKGKYFDRMFMNAGNGTCLTGIDTRAKISTKDMFLNSKFTHPDATELATIEAGALWQKAGTPCGMNITGITEVTQGTCHIASGQSNCQSTGTYRIDATNVSGTATYKWHVVSGGTIVGADNQQTVDVQSNPSGEPTTISIYCDVTDDVATINSGTYSFTHTRTGDDLRLTLNVYDQNGLVLRDFIDANNPHNIKNVIITIPTGIKTPSVLSGTLTGYNVTLINYGEIRGTDNGWTALNVTSPMKLINNGWIKGAGGKGGTGAKGADDTYQKHNVLYNLGSWKARDKNPPLIEIYYNNVLEHTFTVSGNPYSYTKLSYNGITYTRGALINCVADACAYRYTREWYTTEPRYGGAGGAGGDGAHYGHETPDAGSLGSPSTPSGGNSGYRGGAGGDWGQSGSRGEGMGYGGQVAGDAIKGSANLDPSSVTGNVIGRIV